VKNGNITSHEAFDIALGLETGMLERGYFEVFQGGSVEFIRRLQRLKAETQAHTDKIRSQIDRKHWL
jgi:hypothetical protein